jgi:hypothetical protein
LVWRALGWQVANSSQVKAVTVRYLVRCLRSLRELGLVALALLVLWVRYLARRRVALARAWGARALAQEDAQM